jgi:hypothetical protein
MGRAAWPGASLRNRLPAEKEAGFYVEYDEQKQEFTSPANAVEKPKRQRRKGKRFPEQS